MRASTLLLCAALAGCTDPAAAPPKKTTPAPVLAPPRNRADPLLVGVVPAPPDRPGEWVGEWAGTRPFDPADPLAHRGPTRVVVEALPDGRLLVREGVGAAMLSAELERDPANPNVARGTRLEKRKVNAVALDGSPREPIELERRLELAAILSGDQLQLARVLEQRGAGIEPTDERDVVALERLPPPPPAPPPPAGLTVLAAAQSPDLLALADAAVVWTHSDGAGKHAIRSVPREGGEVRELAVGLDNVRGLAVAGAHVYFSELGAGRIARVPLAGGAVAAVAEARTTALAVDDSRIAWATLANELFLAPRAGGEPQQLLKLPTEEDMRVVALAERDVIVATAAIDYTKTGRILRVSPRGQVATLVDETVCGGATVVDGAVLFSVCDSALRRVPVRGGKVTTLARDQPDAVAAVRAGPDVVYALGAARGELRAVAWSGGAPRTLLRGEAWFPDAIAVDPRAPSTLYVLDRGTRPGWGRIGRIDR